MSTLGTVDWSECTCPKCDSLPVAITEVVTRSFNLELTPKNDLVIDFSSEDIGDPMEYSFECGDCGHIW